MLCVHCCNEHRCFWPRFKPVCHVSLNLKPTSVVSYIIVFVHITIMLYYYYLFSCNGSTGVIYRRSAYTNSTYTRQSMYLIMKLIKNIKNSVLTFALVEKTQKKKKNLWIFNMFFPTFVATHTMGTGETLSLVTILYRRHWLLCAGYSRIHKVFTSWRIKIRVRYE